MQIALGTATLVTSYEPLEASFVVVPFDPETDGYPGDAPAETDQITGNTYNDSSTMFYSRAQTLGLLGLFSNDIDGLCIATNNKTPVRLYPWMLARVQEATADMSAYDTLTQEFGTWLAYWMDYAFAQATVEAPAAILTIR